MDYKILVLDIDGTLYNSEKRITSATKAAIYKAREQGNIIAIASGRPLPGIHDVSRELELAEKGGYIMAYNGGRILNVQTNEYISEITLPPEYIPRIAALAEKYGVAVVGHASEMLVTEQPDDEIINLEARLNKMPVVEIPSLADYRENSLYKCIITGDGDKLVELEKIAAKEFEGELSVYRSEPYFLEVLPLGIDKARGIDVLAAHLGMTKDEVIACGDGFNDLSMIKHAGLGVAMANAQKVVKESADYVTDSCDDDGLVSVIEKFLLK